MPGRLYRVAEVAERLSCGLSNVYDAIRRGDLGAYRIGRGRGGIRVSEEQIEEFLRSRERFAREEPSANIHGI